MRVTFLPSQLTAEVTGDKTIMQALIDAGLELDAPCGGRGVCKKCKVKVTDADGTRVVLACQTKIENDMTVDISGQDEGHRILMGGITRNIIVSPAVVPVNIRVPKPSTSDLRSCWERFRAEVSAACGNRELLPNPAVAAGLYELLEKNDYHVQAVVFNNEILAARSVDAPVLGIAYDIGTTTIAAYLVDLTSGKDLAQGSLLNPQVKYGADVIMRTKYAIENGVSGLTEAVRSALNEIAVKALKKARANAADVFAVTIVGNTCMHHLFSGISPASLAYAPYTPAITEQIVGRAGDYGFKFASGAKLMLLSNIAGFVGADTVGAALAAEMDTKEKLTLLIDIGTNGEMVLGTKERLVACSTAAGPAFEGALISCGMRGAEGAIDHVHFVDGQIDYSVIGGVKPLGICGSGLIDLLSELVRTGVVEPGGRLVQGNELEGTDAAVYADNIIALDKQRAFLIYSDDERQIYFTQRDVREVQLAKGAMAAGIEMMSKRLGVKSSDINLVMIAGAFGSYMSPASACGIGLIPPVLHDKVMAIGNAAGQGARLSLLSSEEYKRSAKLAKEMDYLELAADPEFQDVFVDMLEFPGGED